MATQSLQLDVRDLLSPLSAHGVEAQLRKLAGVHRAELNAASGALSIAYDDARVSEADLRREVAECGHHCAGMPLPGHLCAAPRPAEHHVHETSAAPASDAHAMAHEMGHGAGMDLEAMARDMRRRFVVAGFCGRHHGVCADGHGHWRARAAVRA